MRLGAGLPIDINKPPNASMMAEDARRLVGAGFDSIWVFDCIGRGELVPDPLMQLAVVAAVTEEVELGTGVLQVPLRETVELANRVFTTQLICGDRFLFGVGFGFDPHRLRCRRRSLRETQTNLR